MKKPLYQQVILDLEKKIKTEMKPNNRLPSERQLLKEYGVSRNTIRLALNNLEERGIIYRLHGKRYICFHNLSRSDQLRKYVFI